jgi:hypothetical protein
LWFPFCVYAGPFIVDPSFPFLVICADEQPIKGLGVDAQVDDETSTTATSVGILRGGARPGIVFTFGSVV